MGYLSAHRLCSIMTLLISSAVKFLFGRIVLEELLDQVDVSHDHSSATVTAQFECIHGIAVDCVSTVISLPVEG